MEIERDEINLSIKKAKFLARRESQMNKAENNVFSLCNKRIVLPRQTKFITPPYFVLFLTLT